MKQRKSVIAPIVKTKLTLKQLMDKVTPENIHREVETGPATGNEAW